MKKLILISLCFLISSHLLIAQKTSDVTIEWGEKQKIKASDYLGENICYLDGKYFMLKNKKQNFFKKAVPKLSRYSNELNLELNTTPNLKEGKKDKILEKVIYMDNEMYLFSSFKNQKLKKNFLFFQSIDKETLELDDDLQKVAEIDYSSNSRYNAGNFGFEMSRDSTKLMVYYNLPYNKNENEKFGFHVFDKHMNEIWKKDITLPYTDNLFVVKNYELDNNGNAHILGKVYNDYAVEKIGGNPNYNFEILSYLNNGSTLKKYHIKTKDKYLSDMQIVVNKQQDIICTGFYSDRIDTKLKKVLLNSFYKEPTIVGSFFIKVDGESTEIINENYEKFSVGFMTKHMKGRKKKSFTKQFLKGKNKELSKYNLHDLIIRTDGGIVMIAEQYSESSVTTAGTSRKDRRYVFGNIIVINISPDGVIEWSEKIAKKQSTLNDFGYTSSYYVAVTGDKLRFIYNDNIKNLNYKEGGKKLSNYSPTLKGIAAMMVTIDSDGKQSKEILYKVEDEKLILYPQMIKQIHEKEVLLYGLYYKSHSLGKMTFVN